MSDTSIQGHEYRGYYLHEDNGFNSPPNDSTYKAFGADARVTQAEGSNQAIQVFEPGNRVPIDIVERLFDGAFSVEFTYTNPWWLNFLFGAPSTANNGDGSHTHSWTPSAPQPQRIFLANEQDSSDETRYLGGCMATQVNLSSSVNDMGRITITGAYADDGTQDSTMQSQPNIDLKPMTFADTSLSLGGTTLGYVQQGALQMNREVELIPELGTRVPIDFSDRPITPAVNFQKIEEADDNSHLEKMYGASAASSVQEDVSNEEDMKWTFDNGNAAGAGINKLVATMKGTFPESYAQEGLGDPTADVIEQINRLTKGVDFDATNEVSSAK
jgi:hypothetical protein